MTIPSIIGLILLIIALFRPTRWLLICAFGAQAFGSLAVLPPNWTGGVTLLLGSMAFLMLIAKTLIAPGGVNKFLRNALNMRHLGLLAVFTVVAVVGAFVLPKIFLGQAYIFPLRNANSLGASIRAPLQPTNGNITQSAYLLLSFMAAVVFSDLIKQRNFARDFGWAMIAGGVMIFLSGIIDMLTSATGTAAVLAGFRNASYAIMAEGDIDGVRRIIGLMPEASAFGTMAITFFAMLLFGRNLFTPTQRSRIVMPVAFGCGTLAAMSTSSTAYVALTVVVLVYFADASRRLGAGSYDEKRQAVGEFAAIAALSLIGLVAVLSFDRTRETIFNLIDTMLFKKTQSGSFLERTSWNTQALTGFIQTYGMGVGVGSVRTSNFFINIISSTGIIGSLFFLSFIIKVALAKPKVDDERIHEMVHMAKLTLIPISVMAYLVGTIPDYGIVTGCLFGIIIGGTAAVKKRRVKKPAPPPLRPEPAKLRAGG
ncbi:MAG TPA: hypothetical protein VG839_04050 [Asticcacaulis sp.]|nr:hypothetical protein [Asticcacaulis sp.]